MRPRGLALRLTRAALPALVLAGLAVPAGTAAPAEAAEPTAATTAAEYGAYSRDVPEPARESCDPADCLDARDHGAVGGDGGSDSAALARAAAAAVAAGKVLWLPPGIYTLTQPFRPPTGLTVAGAGIDRTVLKLDWASRAAFGYSYLVHARQLDGTRASGVTVRDLTVHGSRNESGCANNVYDPVLCRVNQAGGIGTGDGWTVQQVRLTNLNYFKLGLFAVTGVKVLHNRFDNDEPGGNSSGGEDNIGGGSGARDILIEGNRWAESAVGNAIDLTVASRVTTRGNESWKYSIIYEAVTDSSIVDNVLHGTQSGINVKSNAHYGEDSVPTFGVIQPRNVLVARNRIYDVPFLGINLFYFPTKAYEPGLVADPTFADRATVTGGGNVIRDNLVVRSRGAGIAAWSCRGAVYDTPDLIEGNTVVDTSWYHKPPFTSGCGQFPVPTGIAVSGAAGTVVGTNTVVDTRVGPPMTSGTTPTTGPQTAHAVTVGSSNSHVAGSRLTAVASVAAQQVTNLASSTPVRWNLPVPTEVVGAAPATAGGTVLTVRGYGLHLVDRATPGGVTIGGMPATSLGVPTTADVTGLAEMTVTAPRGTGTVPLVLRATDGRTTGGSVAVTYAPPPNRVPDAAPDAVTIAHGSEHVRIDVLANDTDPDADPLTVTAVGSATRGTTDLVDGAVHYTPDRDVATATTDTFAYTISDGRGGSATGTVTVALAARPNRAPVAVADTVDLPHGTGAVAVDVLANDTDPDSDRLTVVTVGGATRGTTDLVDGAVRYSPGPAASTDTFTYTVDDGRGLTATGTVRVTVAARPNRPPVAVADRVVLPAGSGPVTIDVLGNDSDPDADPLTVLAVGQPARGTATSDRGAVRYSPDPELLDGVTDTLTYTVSDGRGATATGSVTITLPALPRTVTAALTAPRVVTGDAEIVVRGHASRGDVDSVRLLVDGRLVGERAGSSGAFTVRVAGLATGRHVLTARVTSGERTATRSHSITVAPPSEIAVRAVAEPLAVRVALTGLRDGAVARRVTVRVDGRVVPTTRTADGTWRFSTTRLTAGAREVTVQVRDQYGTVSLSEPVTVTVTRGAAARRPARPAVSPRG